MGAPTILAENFFNTSAYAGHVVSANEEPAGAEAFRVGTGRRHALTNRWTTDTANAAAWVKVASNRVRACDLIVLDRGHNLAGKTVRLQVSLDDFATTPREVFAVTVPSTPGGSLDGALGCVTEEGAWLKRFPVEAGMQWRLYVDAMGADLRPQLVGLYLGMSWRPAGLLDLPWAEEETELSFTAAPSDAGWVGASNLARGRAGELHIKLDGYFAYDLARLHIEGHFGRRRPTWIIYDDDQADRAVLAVRPQGRAGFRFDSGWAYRQATVSWTEHEPQVI